MLLCKTEFLRRLSLYSRKTCKVQSNLKTLATLGFEMRQYGGNHAFAASYSIVMDPPGIQYYCETTQKATARQA